ncbi:hypothetical protein HK405_010696 [Cladochytrium tenue]|nr:hypothetical protein HK405_010696 [Cladochytrium tenue]
MDAAIKEHDKLVARQDACTRRSQDYLDALLGELAAARATIAERISGGVMATEAAAGDSAMEVDGGAAIGGGGEGDAAAAAACAAGLGRALSAARRAHERINEAHGEVHAATSRFGKAVEKRFGRGEGSGGAAGAASGSTTAAAGGGGGTAGDAWTAATYAWDADAFDGKDALVRRAVWEHLVRQGRFAAAEAFRREAAAAVVAAGSVPVAEAGLTAEEEEAEAAAARSQFGQLHTVLEELRAGRAEAAAVWARERRAELEARGSDLEFRLVSLRFVGMVADGRSDEALAYARAEFGHFRALHMKEIQRLMGSLVYARRLPRSPYRDLAAAPRQQALERQFAREFCRTQGRSSESGVAQATAAGVSALPTLAKMAGILRARAGVEWTAEGELPVEVGLPDRLRFHSVFACPVSKDLGTDANPPYMMACGHVVCKESLLRLGKGSNTTRFKCPYCPTESTGQQAVRVYF